MDHPGSIDFFLGGSRFAPERANTSGGVHRHKYYSLLLSGYRPMNRIESIVIDSVSFDWRESVTVRYLYQNL